MRVNTEQVGRACQVSGNRKQDNVIAEQGANFQDLVFHVLSMINASGGQLAQGQTAISSETGETANNHIAVTNEIANTIINLETMQDTARHATIMNRIKVLYGAPDFMKVGSETANIPVIETALKQNAADFNPEHMTEGKLFVPSNADGVAHERNTGGHKANQITQLDSAFGQAFDYGIDPQSVSMPSDIPNMDIPIIIETEAAMEDSATGMQKLVMSRPDAEEIKPSQEPDKPGFILRTLPEDKPEETAKEDMEIKPGQPDTEKVGQESEKTDSYETLTSIKNEVEDNANLPENIRLSESQETKSGKTSLSSEKQIMKSGKTSKDKPDGIPELQGQAYVQKNTIIDSKTSQPKLTRIQNMQGIAVKIAEEFKLINARNESTLKIKLKPEQLGEMEVRLKLKDGLLNAEIMVRTMSAKEALESQLQYLKDRLKNQNITLNEVNIGLQQNSQESGRGKNNGFYQQHSRYGYLSSQANREENGRQNLHTNVLKSGYLAGMTGYSLDILA